MSCFLDIDFHGVFLLYFCNKRRHPQLRDDTTKWNEARVTVLMLLNEMSVDATKWNDARVTVLMLLNDTRWGLAGRRRNIELLSQQPDGIPKS